MGDEDEDPDGDGDEDDVPEPPPPEPVVGLVGDGLVEPPPPDGVAVGDGLLVGDGLDVGDSLGEGVDVGASGGATPGGTAPLFSRSCCHDQPTDPPAGTVRPPTPDDEYVHVALEPSAHHRPQ